MGTAHSTVPPTRARTSTRADSTTDTTETTNTETPDTETLNMTAYTGPPRGTLPSYFPTNPTPANLMSARNNMYRDFWTIMSKEPDPNLFPATEFHSKYTVGGSFLPSLEVGPNFKPDHEPNNTIWSLFPVGRSKDDIYAMTVERIENAKRLWPKPSSNGVFTFLMTTDLVPALIEHEHLCILQIYYNLKCIGELIQRSGLMPGEGFGLVWSPTPARIDLLPKHFTQSATRTASVIQGQSDDDALDIRSLFHSKQAAEACKLMGNALFNNEEPHKATVLYYMGLVVLCPWIASPLIMDAADVRGNELARTEAALWTNLSKALLEVAKRYPATSMQREVWAGMSVTAANVVIDLRYAPSKIYAKAHFRAAQAHELIAEAYTATPELAPIRYAALLAERRKARANKYKELGWLMNDQPSWDWVHKKCHLDHVCHLPRTSSEDED